MHNHYGTRPACARSAFEAFSFRALSSVLPLHLHVRRRVSDGTVVSLLVYAPTRGAWFEGADMPVDVRAFAVDALRLHLDAAAVFASEVRP
jgi:hypothetical protein